MGHTRGVRLDPALYARLTKLAKRMSTPWHRATVSEAIRGAILEGVVLLEAKFPPLPQEEEATSSAARRASAGRKKLKPKP